MIGYHDAVDFVLYRQSNIFWSVIASTVSQCAIQSLHLRMISLTAQSEERISLTIFEPFTYSSQIWPLESFG
jgi:hypothetical protein